VNDGDMYWHPTLRAAVVLLTLVLLLRSYLVHGNRRAYLVNCTLFLLLVLTQLR